jgi:hypothetical protein
LKQACFVIGGDVYKGHMKCRVHFSPNLFTQRHAQEIAQRQAVSLLKRYHGKSPKKGYCHEESKIALASVGAKGAEKERITVVILPYYG